MIQSNLARVPTYSEAIADLLLMLTYKRPAQSAGERAFVDRFIVPTGALPDDFGNYWLTVGHDPAVLWSSHTDTVHHTSGPQRVTYGGGIATSESGECLGADCTAGVWLMIQMIEAGVPGLYIFHREEEVGGLGSRYIAKNHADRLAGIQYAIAFDRKGTHDVITHQGGRTASDAFAKSVCALLAPLTYTPDDSGIFTDTANYSNLIPECSNISVGYHYAHSKRECLDVTHLEALLERIIAADWDKLVCSRDPSEVDPDDDFSRWSRDFPDNRWQSGGSAPFRSVLEAWVYENPSDAADFIESMGFTLAEIRDAGFGR